MSGNGKTISEQTKIDRALKELEEEIPSGGEISILFSKHRNKIRSIKTRIIEPFSIQAVKRRLRSIPFGDIVLFKTVDKDGKIVRQLDSTRVERFDKEHDSS